MFYNKFCYPHVIWAAFTSAITHAITPPPLDPHVSVTPTGCSIGLPPVPNGKKKKKKKNRSVAVMCMTSWELSWISFCEVWTKGEGGCSGLSALWVDLLVWRSGATGVIRMQQRSPSPPPAETRTNHDEIVLLLLYESWAVMECVMF